MIVIGPLSTQSGLLERWAWRLARLGGFTVCCEDEGMRIELTLDCVDLDAVAAFWRAALGYAGEGTIGGRYVALTGDGPGLTLQRVPEPRRGKNRMHLDLLVDDVDAEVARLRALGATMVTPVAQEEFGQRWFVLADLEGNEFCVANDPIG